MDHLATFSRYLWELLKDMAIWEEKETTRQNLRSSNETRKKMLPWRKFPQ
jgi:hypothetical protein